MAASRSTGRLLLVTDAYTPQVNGVVTTLTRTEEILRTMRWEVLTWMWIPVMMAILLGVWI